MNPQTEARCLKIFFDAVDRGKKLHPGPFSRNEWKEALLKEIKEFEAEKCYECGFGGAYCGGCRGIDNKQLTEYRNEALDIAVVAYRMVCYLDEIIENDEIRIEKEAMEHDPR